MTIDALRAIKHRAIAIIGFVAAGVVFILMFGENDDLPAGLFMSVLVAFVSSGIVIVAAMFERNLRNALRTSEGNRG